MQFSNAENGDDDDDDYSDNEYNVDFYEPDINLMQDRLDDVLLHRERFSQHTTGLSTEAGWVQNWTLQNAIREFIQNMLDFLRHGHGPVYFFKIDSATTWPESISSVLRTTSIKGINKSTFKSTNGYSFFEAKLSSSSEALGYLIEGNGLFALIQNNSTLFRCHLFQKSSKIIDLEYAGNHGCGFKEAALVLKNQKCEVKMFMPANVVSSDEPGDAWTFKLSPQSILIVKSSKLKSYKARALVTLITGLKSDFRFDPSLYLAFRPDFNPADRIPVRVKPNAGVLDYTLLLDENRCFNYGIYVQNLEVAREVNMGLDGRHKLTDRYRLQLTDAKERFALAIKYGARACPDKVIPRLLACTESLEWIFENKSPRIEEVSNYHNFTSLKQMLVTGISKWKHVEKSFVILADDSWSAGEIAFAKFLDYSVFTVKDSLMKFYDDVFISYTKKVAVPEENGIYSIPVQNICTVNTGKSNVIYVQDKSFSSIIRDDYYVRNVQVYVWDLPGGLEDKSAVKSVHYDEKTKRLYIAKNFEPLEVTKLKMFKALIEIPCDSLIERAFQTMLLIQQSAAKNIESHENKVSQQTTNDDVEDSSYLSDSETDQFSLPNNNDHNSMNDNSLTRPHLPVKRTIMMGARIGELKNKIRKILDEDDLIG